MSKPKVITVLSGGLDSTVLAHLLAAEGYEQHFVTFDYGQRHRSEIFLAQGTAIRLEGKHSIIPLDIGGLLVGSSLTDFSIDVPDGHYESASMKQTVVPGRNAIMLSIAWGIAVAENAEMVACGVHAGDHAIYDDCRLAFIEALSKALALGTGKESVICEIARVMPLNTIALRVPFISRTKAQIVELGRKLLVPFELTQTCYKGGVDACGVCGTCTERLAAFAEAGFEDPLEYNDRISWKKCVDDFNNTLT